MLVLFTTNLLEVILREYIEKDNGKKKTLPAASLVIILTSQKVRRVIWGFKVGMLPSYALTLTVLRMKLNILDGREELLICLRSIIMNTENKER